MASTDPLHGLEPKTITSRNAIVHLVYDIDNPPPRPTGEDWVRFVCISDTHSHFFRVPDGDVLLHSGDLTKLGRLRDMEPTAAWLNSLPHPIKIVIAGNHDLTLDTEWYQENWSGFHRAPEDQHAVRLLLTGQAAIQARVRYLEYTSTEFQVREGGKVWKVYGSPGSPWFGGWAFNYDRGEHAEVLHSEIPNDTDILLTHGPPSSILDLVNRDRTRVGCRVLMQRVSEIQPALHVFGHIHEAHGAEIREWEDDTDYLPEELENQEVQPQQKTTVFVNAANMPMGRARQVGGPGFQPVIVDLRET